MGGIISIALIWAIYLQLNNQADNFQGVIWKTGASKYLVLCLAIMPINLALESVKWRLLAGSAQPMNYFQAVKSVLAGIALSIITPNRIGEYPGRILYLKRKNTFRLISVSILGIVAQMLTMFIYGLAGLFFYNLYYPATFPFIALTACLVMTIVISLLYWSFEKWAPIMERIKWLRRFNIYGQLLKRFSTGEQLTILLISLLRYGIYTAQYLILLKWMDIHLPLLEGFLMSALFFWVIAVVPNIALAELPQRGQIAIFLFQRYTDNLAGVLVATAGVWAINLILPAIVGSLLVLKMRFVR